ncbi:sulfite exporter TauE/SafE family protein [Pseudorhodoferax sp. Leaf267]|uniref:sulfite exporter TauE/SafE family protein n=1 Tax=Pseudorhodoferax sp. Leaf267 TaxID=1736316 RepID=UPI0006FC3683|nr:sulfite exporter TauE/SafE family protein [Pseudorhodoferax sp. Leaf267]KQP18131.1 permease [Pseudorhodoferax sp. Leaf267]
MISLYLWVAVGAAAAGFVQGLSGFAFSMVSLSVWAWALDPQLGAVLAIFGGWVGQVIAAFTMRRRVDKGLLWPFVAGGLCGLPVGLWLLPLLDVPAFNAALGLVLVVCCPVMLMSARLPRVQRGGRVADALAGAAGGVMGGIGGLSGVVPTLWCTLRGFDRDAQRAVIQNFNLAMLSVALALHVAAGHVTVAMLPLLAIVAAAVLVPVLLGARLYLGLSELAFRRLVLSLLTVSGVAILASALPALLQR